jgi:hypothetical protein
MTYTKTIKDERGTVNITVKLWHDMFGGTDKQGNLFRYDVSVSHKEPKKRTEIWDMSIATPQEILDAKLEYWNLIKPQ